jgi:uncharacterized LabA/DUF88 family protein
MTNRSAVLIEGRNFYAGCKRWARGQQVDYMGLRELIAEKTGTEIQTITYYMGIDQNGQLPHDSSARIDQSIGQLQDAGYAVRTFPLRLRNTRCRNCGIHGDEIVEKQVDSAMAVDALLGVNAVETFVLVTSDTDQLPLIAALRGLGRKVWIVAWKSEALSQSLVEAVDAVLVLHDHRENFVFSPARVKDAKFRASDMLDEIGSAEQQFRNGYVGLHYFLTHWKSEKLPRAVDERSALLNELIENGQAIQYVAADGSAAIKRVNS